MGSSFSCVMHEQANILVITLPQVRNNREQLPQEMTMHVEMFLSEQHIRKSTTQSREKKKALEPFLKITSLEASVPC